MSRILIIDNYDSFTYNLASALRRNAEVDVYRNDAVPEKALAESDGVVFSPGPGLPKEAGPLMALLGTCLGRIPVLGVCLGMQAIGEYYGGRLQVLDRVFHGVPSLMQRVAPEDPILEGIDEVFEAGRYHSWVLDPYQLPDLLEVTAIDESGQIMALRHSTEPVFGVQFHPESVLTPSGERMLHNFLRVVDEHRNRAGARPVMAAASPEA